MTMPKMGHALCSAIVLVSLASMPARAQDAQTGRLMRQKLDHTQKILEAVVTANWSSLDTHTRALEALTNDPRWTVLKFPEYAQYSRAFVAAVQDLRSAATARDTQRAPTAYATLVLKCTACHQYMARARIAN